MPFKLLSLNDESVPQEIKEWAAVNSLQFFTGSKISGEWNYLFISAGEKPTAGYSVGIVNIYSEGGSKLKVNYRITGPAPGEMVAQSISHPSVLVRIPASNENLDTNGHRKAQITAADEIFSRTDDGPTTILS